MSEPGPEPTTSTTSRARWVVVVLLVVGVGLAASFVVPRLVGGGGVTPGELKVGDCVERWSDGGVVSTLRLTPCTSPHQAQVVGTDDLGVAGDPYPGQLRTTQLGSDRCTVLVEALDQSLVPSGGVRVAFLLPVERDWQRGSRRVRCLVLHDPPLTASVLPTATGS